MAHLTTAAILAEIESGQPIVQERADWFRGLLQNGIANCRDRIRFFDNARDVLAPAFDVDGSIGFQQAKITKYVSAIGKLPCGHAVLRRTRTARLPMEGVCR
jgi:hypothetical protein